MTVETFSPEENLLPTKHFIDQLIKTLKPNEDSLTQIIDTISESDKKIGSKAHLLPKSFWESKLQSLPDEVILELIKFFVLAETSFSQWQFLEKSPAIACSKFLRNQKKRLPQSLILWIKEHSNNKFLPYGPL